MAAWARRASRPGIIAEELAYGDFNISAVPVGVSLLGAIIMSSGVRALAEYWVPRMVSGETLMGVCVTEPSGGSDAGALKLRCRRDGDYYVLDGEKTSITFADCADAFIVFARTGSAESGAAGVTALIVPADAPGVARTRFNDVGSRIIGRGSVFFEGVRVPVENRLGEENQGFTHVMRGFDFSRALISLQCVGCAQASLDEAWDYTKERTAFNAPIASYQGVTFPLVEGESQIAAIRQLSYHAIALARRRPAAHGGGGDGQMDGAEDRVRRHPPMPAHLRPLWLVDGSAAPAADARRDGPRDRRRHRRHHEADRRPRARRPRRRAIRQALNAERDRYRIPP